MPELESVIEAVKRISDFAEVNERRGETACQAALMTLNASLGIEPESIGFIAHVCEAEGPGDIPLNQLVGYIMFGMTVALTAVQLEQDQQDLARTA